MVLEQTAAHPFSTSACQSLCSSFLKFILFYPGVGTYLGVQVHTDGVRPHVICTQGSTVEAKTASNQTRVSGGNNNDCPLHHFPAAPCSTSQSPTPPQPTSYAHGYTARSSRQREVVSLPGLQQENPTMCKQSLLVP
jgi:hypothetical protein